MKKSILVTAAILTTASAFAGTIVAWGDNSYGQCDVPAGDDFIAISAYGLHNLALRSDGSLVAWGDNTYGACNIPYGNDFASITTGYYHGLALKTDGSLVGWQTGSFVSDLPLFLVQLLREYFTAMLPVLSKAERSGALVKTHFCKRRWGHIIQRTMRPIVIIIHTPAVYNIS